MRIKGHIDTVQLMAQLIRIQQLDADSFMQQRVVRSDYNSAHGRGTIGKEHSAFDLYVPYRKIRCGRDFYARNLR